MSAMHTQNLCQDRERYAEATSVKEDIAELAGQSPETRSMEALVGHVRRRLVLLCRWEVDAAQCAQAVGGLRTEEKEKGRGHAPAMILEPYR